MLIVRSSKIHEAGCYTTAPIRKGKLVIEYTGPRISNREGERRYKHREHTFLFGMDDRKTLIDGYGMAAFINHSCDPNCETDQIKGKVWIIAARDIAAGEELAYDYNLYDGDGPAPCYCGSANCRGTLYEEGRDPSGKKERKKRSKGKKKQTRARDQKRRKMEPPEREDAARAA
jgi:SET domain-containing protein